METETVQKVAPPAMLFGETRGNNEHKELHVRMFSGDSWVQGWFDVGTLVTDILEAAND